MTPDLINSGFEFSGGLMVCLHVRSLLGDKRVLGVNVWGSAAMTLWGIWNLWYYPHLGQWASFFGGLLIVAANAVWLGLALWYSSPDLRAQFGYLWKCPVCEGRGHVPKPVTLAPQICPCCWGQGYCPPQKP